MPRLNAKNRDVLTKRRKKLKLSQQKLADASGVHRVNIAKIEAGMREPSAGELGKLADALGLDVSVTTTVRIRPRK